MTHLSAEQILAFNCLTVREKRRLNKQHPHPPGENNRVGKQGYTKSRVGLWDILMWIGQCADSHRRPAPKCFRSVLTVLFSCVSSPQSHSGLIHEFTASWIKTTVILWQGTGKVSERIQMEMEEMLDLHEAVVQDCEPELETDHSYLFCTVKLFSLQLALLNLLSPFSSQCIQICFFPGTIVLKGPMKSKCMF